MDKDAYQRRAADRQKEKDAASANASDAAIHQKEELARLNKEQLDDFKDHFDVPSSPKDGTKNSDAG